MTSIKTSCKDCCFRINDKNGNQESCDLGRLKIFKDRMEADKTDDHYTINRFCSGCSNKKVTKEEILEEFKINVCVVVDGTEQEYWDTLKSILKQEMLPQKIVVVFRDIFDQDMYSEYFELFNNLNVQLVFKKYFDGKTFLNMVDDVSSKCGTKFYIPVKNPVSRSLVSDYNAKINHLMLPINAEFTPDYYNSLVSCYFHNLLGGNRVEPVYEKCKKAIADMVGPEYDKQKETIIFHE